MMTFKDSLKFYKGLMGGIDWQRRKPTLGGRLLFLFASERGVSSLRQHHHSARSTIMDWSQFRRCLEND